MANYSMINIEKMDNRPFPTQAVTLRTPNIFAGLQSIVKQRIDRNRIEITTPYDVTGDPFYIPIGETVILEWDKESEAYQKEFMLVDYHEVTDFLKDERRLPTVVLTTDATPTQHYRVERAFYRTSLEMPLMMKVNRETLDVQLSDIGGGGLAFTHSHPIAVKRDVEAFVPIIDAKGKLTEISISGQTVNIYMIHPRLFRMGVKFDWMKESEQDRIVRFVNGCTGKKRSGLCKTCIMRSEKSCMVERKA